MLRKIYILLLILSLAFIVEVNSALAKKSDDEPVHLTADQLSHDEQGQVVTAIGNVELIQGNRILHSDKMVYKLEEDKVSAIGNVSLLDENGDVHFAEYVELKNEMKDGFVHSLLTILSDGSRFKAVEGERQGGTKTKMSDASFTPCKPCEEDPDKDPLWQIRASKIVHDKENHSVTYDNARLEIVGVPIAYTPVFSHPDPEVKRKSGFLRPKFGWTTQRGAYLKGGYYWDVAPNKDATFRTQPTTEAGVLTEVEWRQRFEHGRFVFNGGLVESDRVEEDGRIEEDRWRGHVISYGDLDINNKWRAGFNYNHTTDKEYLRLYDISGEDILRNNLFVERFSGRNYTNIRAMSFQDVRLGIRPDQPSILPLLEHSMYGEPVALFGGRWGLNFNEYSLYRSGGDQDASRISIEGEWKRRFLSSYGLSTEFTLGTRGDYYILQDRDAADLNPALDEDSNDLRLFSYAHMVNSYPLVRNYTDMQAVIEPVVSLTVSPTLNDNDDNIPNEDSIDVQLDTSNLFEYNRFPGDDKQEDGTHVTYGIGGGLYGFNSQYARFFLGQSYRFQDDTLFPDGSGLEQNSSDIVGRISVYVSKYFETDYRFQLNEDNLESKRHELFASGGSDRIRVNTRYLYADTVTGTGFTETREQIQFGGTVKLNEDWLFSARSLTDIGEEPGLRSARMGLKYEDECFLLALTGVRNLVNRSSGENETTLMMRIGLKHLGEINTPEFLLESERQ